MENKMLKPNATQNQIITPTNQIEIAKNWNNAFIQLAKTNNYSLSNEQLEFGKSIIFALADRCSKEKINSNELNMSNFLEQVKHISKLELSISENELFLDIRNNKNTGLKDVVIKKQYQGIQKLLRKYCTQNIVRFLDGVICESDTFEYETDFSTGINNIITHKKDVKQSRNDLSKICGAYAIAYCKDEKGNITPYTCIVDKERLLRAYNCATTKNVWNTDTARMCIKTAYWCLYNDMKPFIEIPINLQESFAMTEDEMNFDNTEDDNIYDMDIAENEINEEDTVFQEPISEPEQLTNEDDTCSECGTKISSKVSQYSLDKFGKKLCYKCQKYYV